MRYFVPGAEVPRGVIQHSTQSLRPLDAV